MVAIAEELYHPVFDVRVTMNVTPPDENGRRECRLFKVPVKLPSSSNPVNHIASRAMEIILIAYLFNPCHFLKSFVYI